MGWILDIVAAIGAVVLKIFAGRTGRVADYLRPIALGIVQVLEQSDKTGKERFEIAFETLVNFAIKAGIEEADHAIALVIEWNLADIRGKQIKKVFDQGLELAREVVADVGKMAIDSDMDKKLEAAEQLRMRLTYDMKEWLTSTNTLLLLVEAAVAETKE